MKYCPRLCRLDAILARWIAHRNGGANENVRVGGDPHSGSLAHPSAMALFMSSIDTDRPLFGRQPKNASIDVRGAALITAPSGMQRSTVIRSPGFTPRWSSRFFLSVTCPLAVTVRVVRVSIACLRADEVRHRCLTVKPAPSSRGATTGSAC